LIEDNQP